MTIENGTCKVSDEPLLITLQETEVRLINLISRLLVLDYGFCYNKPTVF